MKQTHSPEKAFKLVRDYGDNPVLATFADDQPYIYLDTLQEPSRRSFAANGSKGVRCHRGYTIVSLYTLMKTPGLTQQDAKHLQEWAFLDRHCIGGRKNWGNRVTLAPITTH